MKTAVLDFSFGGTPIVETSAQGAIVRLPGEEVWQSPGDPAVPYRSRTVLLPQGMQISLLGVSYVGAPQLVASGVAPKANSTEPDPASPQVATTSFPGAQPVINTRQYFRGYALATFYAFPVDYQAGDGSITFHPGVSVRLTMTPGSDPGVLPVRDLAEDRAAVAKYVENPEMIATYVPTAPAPGAALAGATASLPDAGPHQYVIITTPELASAYQESVTFKEQFGLNPTIVTTDYIWNNYSGIENHDLQDRIRAFIKDAVTNWQTQFVVLGGDDYVGVRYSRVGTDPRSVATEDFNHDGEFDLVTANSGSNDLSVLLGRGDATFDPQVRYGAGVAISPYSVATGDFDRDGNVDLLTANDDSTVAVFLGLGDGTFGASLACDVGAPTFSVAAADFDGDQILDLATGNVVGEVPTVSVLHGLGNGTFELQETYALTDVPFCVATGDFNNDRNVDLVTANTGAGCYTVSVLLGHGERHLPGPGRHV